MEADKPDFTEQFFSIPIELIENLIIPNSALAWFSVCKKYNALAVKHATDRPYLLTDPKRAVYSATYHKNYPLLNALLADQRYGHNYIISQFINICPADMKANLIFLKYFHYREWMTSRILHRAVRSNWMEVIDFALNYGDIKQVEFDSFGDMSQEIFERVILHPKLKWTDRNIYDIATNRDLPDTVKLKILEVPNVNISAVLEKFDHVEIFVDALAENQRVLNSVALQRDLWASIVSSGLFYERPTQYNKIQMVKKILARKLLDPAIDNNYPLRRVLMHNEFDYTSETIAKMLLNDDRVALTLEPFTKNVIYCAITSHQGLGLTAKIKFLLNHPKCKTSWLEEVIKFIFDEQSELKTIDLTEKIFLEHNFDEYLSQETRQRAPSAIKALKKLHAYYYDYYGENYSDEDE